MIRFLNLVCAAACVVAFAGCTLSHDFTFDIVKEFIINQQTGTSYSGSQVIDPRQASSDFDTYVSDLTDLRVLSASYTVTDNSSPSGRIIALASVGVSDISGGPQQTIAVDSNVHLATAVTAGATPLNLDPAATQALVNLLKNSPNKATVYLTATSNGAPTVFTFNLKFTIKATYSKGIL